MAHVSAISVQSRLKQSRTPLIVSPQQIKDAVALCELFAWLEKEVLEFIFIIEEVKQQLQFQCISYTLLMIDDKQIPKGNVTEISAADKAEELRR